MTVFSPFARQTATGQVEISFSTGPVPNEVQYMGFKVDGVTGEIGGSLNLVPAHFHNGIGYMSDGRVVVSSGAHHHYHNGMSYDVNGGIRLGTAAPTKYNQGLGLLNDRQMARG